MKVLSLNLSDGINSFHLSGLENGPTKNFTVKLDMWMNVAVTNNNRYHLKVEGIDLKAFIVANVAQINLPPGAAAIVPGTTPRRQFTEGDARVLIGTGNKGALFFPPNGATQTFNMNFTVVYKPDPNVAELKDDVLLNEIMQSCNIITPGNRTMTVSYEASAPIGILKPIGVVPSFTNELKINCPIPPDQLSNLVNSLRGSAGQATPKSSLKLARTPTQVIPGLFTIP